jgi:hypothetical protein
VRCSFTSGKVTPRHTAQDRDDDDDGGCFFGLFWLRLRRLASERSWNEHLNEFRWERKNVVPVGGTHDDDRVVL